MNETPPLTIEEVDRQACGMLEKNPQLLSLLYDMDLMPEQLEVGSMNWKRMVILCERWTGLTADLSTLRSAAEKMAEALDDVSNTLQSRHAYLNKSTRYKVRDSLTTYRNLPKP
jgi:hypothetical protein